MPKPRGGSSYRLSGKAHDLLALLAEQLGLTKTGVLEMAIRKLAQAELGDSERGTDTQTYPKPQPSVHVFAPQHTN